MKCIIIRQTREVFYDFFEECSCFEMDDLDDLKRSASKIRFC